MIFDNLISAVIFLVCCYFLFWLGKLEYNLIYRDLSVSEELVNKDNCAFALSLVGYYIGLVFAIGKVVAGESAGILADQIDIFIYVPIAIVSMNISTIINDKAILYTFNNNFITPYCIHEHIEKDNVAVGISYAGAIVGIANTDQ
ncbi:MAG: DUF350 domain-containing protein [Candidatus Scalindua sp.]|nr:DUF350 domain-containing protein [Candidatus Scalindua sp.]